MDAIGVRRSTPCASANAWHTRRLGVRVRADRMEVNKKAQSSNGARQSRALRLGFVPLADCAPVVMAYELGLFRKFGLNVVLSRELGWATIRDKVVYGELDAAHALAALPVAATLGLGSLPHDCLTGLVLNLHGNAITLSNELWRQGVRDGASLREQMIRSRHRKTFTFGVVHRLSSHDFLLRRWLVAAGIHPDRDVRIVVVPPPQMVGNLRAGNLDGFCVGEPWNSVAVQARVGWCAAVSAELESGHPEKVLMVRREFAEKREAEHLVLMAALLEACEFCDTPSNHDQIIATLAQPRHVNVSEAALRPGFTSEFDFGHGETRVVPHFNVFHGPSANEPSSDKAAWVLQLVHAAGLGRDGAALDGKTGLQTFRADIFDQARNLLERHRSRRPLETQLTPV